MTTGLHWIVTNYEDLEGRLKSLQEISIVAIIIDVGEGVWDICKWSIGDDSGRMLREMLRRSSGA